MFLRYERFERYRTGQSQTDLKKLDTSAPEPAVTPPSYDHIHILLFQSCDEHLNKNIFVTYKYTKQFLKSQISFI